MKFNYLILALLTTLFIFSCKKDDDDDKILPSLDGSITFTGSEFAKPLETLSFTPKGVKHPDGKGIGYYWKINPLMSKNDTTKTEDATGDGIFSHRLPDSLGTYTITATAFAKGYYSSSAVKYVTVVSSSIENGSITDAGLSYKETDYIVDARDNKKYYTVQIGDQEWLRQNLSYSGENNEIGIPFRDAEVMSKVFGRYYTWEEAQSVCPEGWELPSEADWTELGKYLSKDNTITEGETIKGITGAMVVNAKFNTIKMWEYFPAVKITNSSKLSILPTGYSRISENNNFEGLYNYAAFWTSTENPKNESEALYRYINKENPDLFLGVTDKNSFAASVRCIKK